MHKSSNEVRTEIQALQSKINRIQGNATRDGRDLSTAESSLIDDMQAALHELKCLPVDGPVTMPGASSIMGGGIERNSSTFSLIPPNGLKDYKSLFGGGGHEWIDKDTNFFAAVFSGRHHPGLLQNSMSETIPSDGGFLVPSETAARIHAVSLENEIVMPRCYVQPMRSNEIKIPAMVIGDHSTALFGGFTASYTAEKGTISENSPKARAMLLNAKKLTGLIRFSSELQADTPNGMNQIETLCGKGLAWYRDRAFLKGIGAGEPLGILNASCTVEVDPEVGQSPSTILWENLCKMASRMFAGSYSNSVWVAHQTAIPQLASLAVPVGLGGAYIPAMTEGADGQFRILTRPVVFTEKVETLGSRGDIMLCDFSQYVAGLRSDMRFDTSIHVHFTTDELLSRIIERHDGQPLWDSALTLEDGSTTVSPFVVLGAR